MEKGSKKNNGLIGYVVLVVIAIIILGYFGFDLRNIIESPQVQDNLQYAWGLVDGPVLWIWNLIMDAWNSIGDFVDGFAGNFEEIAPDNRLERYEQQIGQ